MVAYIDAHCHLDFFEDLDDIIKNSSSLGVNVILSNGINQITNRKTLDFSKKYKEVKACLGLYPIEALKLTDEEIEQEINFIRKNKDYIFGIGEVGLDFKYDQENKERQKEIFIKFIRLSKELNKPIFVHSRKAELECIELLENENAKKVIMHCFMGKKKLAERIEKNSWYMTIPTIVCYSDQIQSFAESISMNQLFCETDSPFLHPERKEKNEPANVIKAYKKVAEIKGVTLEELKNIIFMNLQNIT